MIFSDFDESSINSDLAIWIAEPTRIKAIRSQLRLLIWDEFAKRDIEMPYPQRDLHIRSGVPWEQQTPLEANH